MADLEDEGGTSRRELLERVELMEAMIAEGRCTTGRYGWMFVLWGVVNLVGIAGQRQFPHSRWVWPVLLIVGWAIQIVGLMLVRRRWQGGRSSRSRNVGAVWGMMGIALTLYVAAAMIRHITWQLSYISGILMILGLAHATSAAILRWRAQALVAALWWAGGVAIYFVPDPARVAIVAIEMFFGLVVFGLYVMARERRRGRPAVASHA
jgi:hypothetical protein